MPHSSSKSKEHKRARERERSRSRERKHEHRDRGDRPIKQERRSPERTIKQEPMSPDRQVKRERHSTDRSMKRDRHSPARDRHMKRERRSPDRSHIKRERKTPLNETDTQSKWSPGERVERDTHTRRQNNHRPSHQGNHDRHRDDRERNNHRRIHDKRQKRKNEDVDDSQFEYGKPGQDKEEETINEEDKHKPDFGLSGKLADDTNTFRGTVVKYNEPPEARKPKLKWRLYPFKGEEALPVLHIHRQSGYLLGRDRKVADIPVDHPSCSKQHAVLQYRSVEYTKDDGSKGRRTRPYIIDLGSANGTFVNNQQIEAQRYVELLEKDTVKFGFSSRDYVILHDNMETSPEEAD